MLYLPPGVHLFTQGNTYLLKSVSGGRIGKNGSDKVVGWGGFVLQDFLFLNSAHF